MSDAAKPAPIDWSLTRRVVTFGGVALGFGVLGSITTLLFGDPAADRSIFRYSPPGVGAQWPTVTFQIVALAAGGLTFAGVTPLYRTRWGSYLIGPLVLLAAIQAGRAVATLLHGPGDNLYGTPTWWQIALVLSGLIVFSSLLGASARSRMLRSGSKATEDNPLVID